MENEFKTEILSKQELVNMFHEQNNRRIEAEQEVRRLKKDSEHWRKEAEKFERIAGKVILTPTN